jgi:electron transfer flavoprotein alpha subunit
MLDRVFVVAEQRQGAATSHALELCAAGRSIAAQVAAFTWGDGAADVPAQLGAHGAGKVFDLGSLGDHLAGPRVAAAMAEAVAGEAPAAVLAPTSYDGRDVAARLSARLDRPVLANVVGLERDEGCGGLVSSHMLFGGAMVARARFTGPPPGIFLVTAKSFKAGEARLGPPPEVVRAAVAELGATDAARVVARQRGERQGPSLEDARVVVTGGRGLGSAERYALIEQLAQLVGGAPGATRAIVDAGWAPYANQVGQTGRTVKPEVYLAFGVSGATQHLVGMRGAACVAAVNSDPEAPIMKVADLAVVGDAYQVLSRLVEILKAR